MDSASFVSAIVLLVLVTDPLGNIPVFIGLLRLMHLTDTSLGIAGGVILFLIALKMVFPHAEGPTDLPVHGEPFLVPLAIPFIAGPGSFLGHPGPAPPECPCSVSLRGGSFAVVSEPL